MTDATIVHIVCKLVESAEEAMIDLRDTEWAAGRSAYLDILNARFPSGQPLVSCEGGQVATAPMILKLLGLPLRFDRQTADDTVMLLSGGAILGMGRLTPA